MIKAIIAKLFPRFAEEKALSNLRGVFFATAPALFLTLDEAGVIIDANAYWQSFGLSREALIGRDLSGIFHKNDMPGVELAMGDLKLVEDLPIFFKSRLQKGTKRLRWSALVSSTGEQCLLGHERWT